MPAPRRADLADFFDQLGEVQRSHLLALREISLSYAPTVAEKLQWNQPAYLRDGERLWMLQAYGKHCSLRFTPDFFATYIDDVKAAGYECGAGFLKIRYDQSIPEQLCRKLIEARLADAPDDH